VSVLASRGYPAAPQTGDPIQGLADAASIAGVQIFHAGTAAGETPGSFITSGGRVLGITAIGDSLNAALTTAYTAVEKISFPGMQYRKDIGRT
jgi:phosphoribosylamine--glycine ligase